MLIYIALLVSLIIIIATSWHYRLQIKQFVKKHIKKIAVISITGIILGSGLYLLDNSRNPSSEIIGDIGSVIDDLEWDSVMGYVNNRNDVVRLGNSNYFMIAAAGDGLDGFLTVIEVNDTGIFNGDIVSEWEYDETYGLHSSILHIADDIYAIYYQDTSNGVIFTTRAWASDGTLQKTVISDETYTSPYGQHLIHVTGDIYALSYQEYGGGYDHFLETYNITSDGTISSRIDVEEYNSEAISNNYYCSPHMELVDSNTIAIVMTDTSSDGMIYTYNISDSGVITDDYADYWEFDGAVGKHPHILHISDNIFAIAYQGTDNDGFIKTLTIDDDGSITKSWINDLEFDETNTEYPTIFTIIEREVYGITYRGVDNDGYVCTFNLSTSGLIGDSIISVLEFEEGDTYYYSPILHISTDYYSIFYSGVGTDGWAKSINISSLPQFQDGDGSSGDPFLITNWKELSYLDYEDYRSMYYILNNSLNSSTDFYSEYASSTANGGKGWEPMCEFPYSFYGAINGNNYTISDFYINNQTTDYTGLFSQITGYGRYSVKDLNINNVTIISSTERVGVLAGLFACFDDTGSGFISNISVTNITITIYNGSYGGGLLGRLYSDSPTLAIVENCSSVGGDINVITNISCNGFGGLIGEVTRSKVIYSYSTINVTAVDAIQLGGFIGKVYNQTIIRNSYSTGDALTDSTDTTGRIGGFIGYGYLNCLIENCYSRGDVKGYQRIGGFIGRQSETTINNSFSTGYVDYQSATYTGGFVGSTSSATNNNNFWDNETSGMTTSYGGANVVGKSTTDMKTFTTFDGSSWDITNSTRFINDGYPFLSWQNDTSESIWLISYPQAIFYFDSYDSSSEKWSQDPGNMVDGSETTYATQTTSTTWVKQYLDNNTCDGNFLGNIHEVYIRFLYNTSDGLSGSAYLNCIPLFDGSDEGSNFSVTSQYGYQKLWSPWFDITDDTNAPVTWDWSDVESLECIMNGYKASYASLKCYKVEILVVYTPSDNTPPVLTSFTTTENSRGWDRDGDDVLVNWVVSDSDGDDIDLYFTFSKGGTARTPTTSDYDAHLVSVSGSESSYDLNWENNVASWTNYQGTVQVRAVAHDGESYSSEIYSENIYSGIDSTQPTYVGWSNPYGYSYNWSGDYWVTGGDTFMIEVSHTDNFICYRQYFGFNKDDCTPNSCGGAPYEIKSYIHNGGSLTDWLYDNDYLNINDVGCVDEDTDCWDEDITLNWETYIAETCEDWDYKLHTYLYDGANNGRGYSDLGVWVRVDNSIPTGTITPIDNYEYPTTITGSGWDARSGVDSCDITIYDSTSDKYWTGSVWGALTWLDCDDTLSWEYTDNIDWVSGNTIIITLRVIDRVGLTNSSADTEEFIVNRVPVISNENPTNNSIEQPITLIWNITIEDLDGDEFDWSIDCSNGQSNSSNDDIGGSKELSITGLDYDTQYTIWVNATDYSGSDEWTREWFIFTTREIYTPNNPVSFSAIADGRFEIGLSWVIGDYADKTRVEYHTSSDGGWDVGDHTFLYNGSSILFWDSTTLDYLTPSQTIYFKAWSWNETDGTYSSGVTDSETTDSNIAPSYSNENPTNSTSNQEISLTWSIDINDTEGDKFNWNIDCSNGQSNGSIKVVFNRRGGTTDSYDTTTINWLEDLGYTVDIIDDADVATYNFDDVGLLIVGAYGTSWVDHHTSEATISALDIPVLSFCRGNSRNSLGMATGSGTTDIGSFTVVNNSHDIMKYLGWSEGSYSLGTSQVTHRISSLTSGTNLIMNQGTSGYAGLAEKGINIHFGYHRLDTGNSNCRDLFNKTVIHMTGVNNGTKSVDLTGLEYNTEYTIWVNTTDIFGDSTNEWFTFTTKIGNPEPPSNFISESYSRSQINLSWTKGVRADTTYIRFAEGSTPPIDRTAGILLYNSTGTSTNPYIFSETTQYSFTAWSYNDTYGTYSLTNVTTQNTTLSNSNPTINSESPSNATDNVDKTNSQLTALISDVDNDELVWNIDCSNGESSYGLRESANYSVEIVCELSTPLTYGTTITWWVNVTDGFSWTNESFYFTVRDEYSPSPPSGVTAETTSRFEISLNWTLTDNNAYIERDGLEIYNSSGTSFADDNLLPGTTHIYRLWSWNETDNVYSATNVTVSNTTLTNTPPSMSNETPTNATTSIQTNIYSWTIDIHDGDGDNTSGTIECSNSDDTSWSDEISGTQELVFSNDLEHGTRYDIWVNVTDGYNWTNRTYYFVTEYISIRGLISSDGEGIIYVNVSLYDGVDTYYVYTNITGHYIADYLDDDTYYTITPTKNGYVFDPIYRYIETDGSLTDVDFEGTHQFDSGDGSTLYPFIIKNCTHLNRVRLFPNAHFALGTSELNMSECSIKTWNSGKGFEPICNETTPFTGGFDGGGYKITNLFIDWDSLDYVGLFGYVQDGIILNLALEECNISGGNYTGGFAGYLDNSTITISYLYNNDTMISGDEYAGGLVGGINNSNIINCYSRTNVSGDSSKYGGLIGICYNSLVNYTYSTGNVSGGGGGLIGNSTGIQANNSYFDNQTSGTTTSEGGIGKNTSTMNDGDFWLTTNLSFPDMWFYDENQNDMYPILSLFIEITPPLLREVHSAGSNTQQLYRYLNSSYNPENYTFFNITAYVPTERYTGRWNKNVSDKYFISTGDMTGEPDWNDTENHYVVASRFVCDYTGYYDKIRVFCVWHGMYPMHLGGAIYSNYNNEPGYLLGYTDAWTIPEGRDEVWFPDTSHVWIEINLTSPVFMSKYTDYWLVATTNDSSMWRESKYGSYNLTTYSDFLWMLGCSDGESTNNVKRLSYNVTLDIPDKEYIDPWGDPEYAYWIGDVFNASFTWPSDFVGESWQDGNDTLTTIIDSEDEAVPLTDLLIYAVTSVDISPVNITKVELIWGTGYEDDIVWDEPVNMSRASSSEDYWEYNVTDISSGDWHTWKAVLYDEFGNVEPYDFYRWIVHGETERIYFQCNASNPSPSDPYREISSSTNLYSNDWVFYLYESYYDTTPDIYGDNEGRKQALNHEQGVDGSAYDTGYWLAEEPTDEYHERTCAFFVGGAWDTDVVITDNITIDNAVMVWWIGSGRQIEGPYWSPPYETVGTNFHWGRSDIEASFDEFYIDDLGFGEWEAYMYDALNDTVTWQEFPETRRWLNDWINYEEEYWYNPDTPFNNYTGRITTNIGRQMIGKADFTALEGTNYPNTFDSNSIYQLFMGMDYDALWSSGPNAAIFNNRSHPSFIIFNVPDDDELNITDSNSDGITDYEALYIHGLQPFWNDTDNDSYTDIQELSRNTGASVYKDYPSDSDIILIKDIYPYHKTLYQGTNINLNVTLEHPEGRQMTLKWYALRNATFNSSWINSTLYTGGLIEGDWELIQTNSSATNGTYRCNYNVTSGINYWSVNVSDVSGWYGNRTSIITGQDRYLNGSVNYSDSGLYEVVITAVNTKTLVEYIDTTNILGNYSISLPDGNYTVTPYKVGYLFIPINRSVDVEIDNEEDVNFEAKFPNVPSSFIAETLNRESITLSWSNGLYANNTYIEYLEGASHPTTRGSGILAYNGSLETYTLDSLDFNTQYSFTAWSYTNNYNAWSSSYSITDNTTLSNSPPSFSSINPSNNSDDNLLSFTWSLYISDSEGDTFNWTIECSNEQSNSGNVQSNGTKSLSLSGLTYGTQYTIWVNSTDEYSSSTNRWYYFNTISNVCPSSSSEDPSNTSSSVDISIGSWSVYISDGDGHTTSGNIECSNGQSDGWDSEANGTKTLTLSTLDYETTYYIWVNYTDGLCEVNETFWFTTEILIIDLTTSIDEISSYLITSSTLYLLGNGLTALDNITLYYRFSDDNISWGSWTIWSSSGNPDTSYPWNWNFNFPSGYGYYEFRSKGAYRGEYETGLVTDTICYYNLPNWEVTIRNDGINYIVWLGKNVSASVIKSTITNCNEASEYIAIWNRSSWSSTDAAWVKYYGTGSGNNFNINTFDILTIYLTDTGTQTIEMTNNHMMDYTSDLIYNWVNISANKGWNYSGYNKASTTTLNLIATTTGISGPGEYISLWRDYAWINYIPDFYEPNIIVYRWDVIESKVESTKVFNTGEV